MRDHYRSEKRRPTGLKLALTALCIIAVYAGVLLGVKLIGGYLEHREAAETVGSLEGRFTADKIRFNHHGRTWYYRKHDLTNILMIGVDWEEMKKDDASERYDGQADFLLLVTIDRGNKVIQTLQIDRDTVTPIRLYGPFGDYSGQVQTQISLSHAYGDSAKENCMNTVWAVSHLLGDIPIDAYIAMDIGSIPALNDALGGITVRLEEDFSHYDPTMTQGSTVTLHGKQAEYFVRGRMSVGDGTNASRMRRQKMFLDEAGDRLSKGMSESMDFVGTLFDRLAGHMTTNADRGWLINKAYDSADYDRQDMRTIAGMHCLGEDGFTEFHVDTDALGSLLTEIYFE